MVLRATAAAAGPGAGGGPVLPRGEPREGGGCPRMAAPGPHPAPTGRDPSGTRSPPPPPGRGSRAALASPAWSRPSSTHGPAPLGLWVGETEAGGSCPVG